MLLSEALNKAIEILKSFSVETPAVEAGVILCHVIGRDRAFIYAHGDYLLKPNEQEEFFKAIYARAAGKPVQYITGRQEFMSLEFVLNNDVLIPRHDTEILVETVIDKARSIQKERISILDIGTGSGCIAVSLAYYIPNCRVTAVDISDNALRIAQINANNAGVSEKINFILSDIFDNIKILPERERRFDIIVSNPPYIPTGAIEDLQPEVKNYEPIIALDGGIDGLDFYRRIIDEAHLFLTEKGILAFEVGYNQASEVPRMMEKRYTDLKVIKDLGMIDRVVMGQLNIHLL